ncbi:MAG: SurA N-terminal domain-containing protein [Candidatus Rokuibacteriota bacterium]
MITLMRQYRRTLQIGLLLVIVAFVVTSVVVFGAGTSSVRQDAVATVNGESISLDRYERRFRAYYNAYAQMYRDRFSPEVAQQLGLPQQVVSDLVQEALVVQRAAKEGLALTDAELNAQMHSVPAFQENGRFSLKRYEAFLRAQGLSKPAFEEEMRRQLTRQKVESLIKSGIRVSDAELEQAFAHRQEGVRAAWALIDLNPFIASVTATDEELQKYLDTHPADFRQPERRRIQYVSVNPKDFPPNVTPAAIDTYYEEHAKEFESPPQVRAAHILVKVPETGGSEAEDKAKAAAAETISRVKGGEDFAKLARERSQDPASAVNGGDLGFVGKGEMVPPFEDALFKLKKGELTPEPVRTPFGYHAIKVTDVKEGGKKPKETVATQIRQLLAAEASDRAARAKADELRTALQAAPDFMAEAKARGMTPLETMMVRPERTQGQPPVADSMQETAFGLGANGVSLPIKTPTGWVVMKNVETRPPSTPPLAEIRDNVLAAVRRQRAEALALERAKQLVTDARAGDFAAAAKKAGALTGETPVFTRAKPAERLPGDAMVAALQTNLHGVTDPIRSQQGYYALKVLERVPADMRALAGERETLSREVLTQKQNQAWENWINEAQTKAKVDVSPNLLRRS